MLYLTIIGLTLVLMLGAIARYRHAVKMSKLTRNTTGQNSYNANGRIK